LLAKSDGLPLSRNERQRARRRAGFPEGARHEALSVGLVSGSPSLAKATDADLVLHLIGSHHGRCRPFLRPWIEDQPVTVTVELHRQSLEGPSDCGLSGAGSSVPDRFWRLVRRYGWWGIAYLEALLRLADHEASRREQERDQRSESVSRSGAAVVV
ncbi:MAG: hypothetical protein ACRDGN_12930, partial [bacterium]